MREISELVRTALLVANVFTSAVEPEISASNTSITEELASINVKSLAARIVPTTSLSETSELVKTTLFVTNVFTSAVVPEISACNTSTS